MAIKASAMLSCEALAVLLQQPTIAADQQIICSLLQVCTAWRAEVQQSGRAVTDIVCRVQNTQLAGLAGVGAWLSKHPWLIRTLSISSTATSFRWDFESSSAPIRTILELSVRLAALGGGPRWRLESYQSDLAGGGTPAMLAALPAASLTRLDLTASAAAGSLAEPLKRLTSLSELVVRPHYQYAQEAVVAAIGSLRQLTCLSLSAIQPESLQQLPVQLQQATIRCERGGILKLGHLTDLQHLQLMVHGDIHPGSVLPSQLQKLTINSNNEDLVSVLDLSSLQRLQCLTIEQSIKDPLQLGVLANMSQLHELHLHGQDPNCGNMWSSLTMLRSLGVYKESNDDGALDRTCSLAASASSLTKLHLVFEHLASWEVGDHEASAGLRLCEHLKELTQLKELILSVSHDDRNIDRGFGCLAELDVLQLTAMTRLTRLDIEAEKGVDDTAASASAIALNHLQHLSLHAGRLTTAPLPCLGLLSSLRHLDLPKYSPELIDIGLKFLTRLTQLTHLGGFGVKGPAIDAFWDRIRRLQRQ